MHNDIDSRFMMRAFELAKNGLGSVSPNPMVGCAIVCDGQIIGEGWHQKYGQAHAEVNAINNVLDKSLLKKSTAYVTLEPCSYFGKTPPCADLLVKHQIKRVVIANLDPSPQVNGKGIEILKKAGMEIVTDVLSAYGDEFNKRFFTSIKKKRPYIILKWAQTADGFIARENYDSKWISNEYSRKLVHKWRAEEDAILVGKNTAKYDNPTLNVRDWFGNHPLRLVIDKNLELKPDFNLLNGQIPTVIYNVLENSQSRNLEKVKVDFNLLVEEIFDDLHCRNINSLIVEGGANTLKQFIDSGYWDEARVFSSKQKIVRGIKAPFLSKRLVDQIEIGKDILMSYYPK